jgi:phosphatidylglycerophosphatase A
MRSFLVSLATLFGLGRRFPAPGTAGTVATLPLAAALMWAGPLWHMAFVIALLPIGIAAAEFYEQDGGGHDPKEVVIDEVLGFLVTMTWLPLTWQSLLAGFICFRVLDIFKPFPISRLDKNLPGGLGTVADDLAAGLIANVILHVVLSRTNWLGWQSIIITPP